MSKCVALGLSAFLGLALLAGCDGKDPERLKGVGKKLAQKGRKAADDANLPKVSVTYPGTEAKTTATTEK